MNYTLHLTSSCNMACNYCYVKHEKTSMEWETARKAVDMAAKGSSKSKGIIFFGGEPLLSRDIIYQTVEYCRWLEDKENTKFHFKITTNGLLLDEDFIEFSLRENLFIALSHDGIREAHDMHRADNNGEGTFGRLENKIDMLLKARPYAPVMMVVNPDTVSFFSDSVEYLYEKGFRYIIPSLNYSGKWSDGNMEILKKQYKILGDFYFERTLAEDKFYLSPFEVKISSYINGTSYCSERCELGKKQISVGPDGLLFPCVQFVGDRKFSIGDVDNGINKAMQNALYMLNEEEKESCIECAIRKRCNHYCGCMNKQSTGRIDRVSPILCGHEKMLMPIADRLAEKLYKKRNPMFIQKHYNDMFPLVSLIEDSTSGNVE